MPHATATVNGVEVARSSTWEVVDGNIYVRYPHTIPPPLLNLNLSILTIHALPPRHH